MYRDRHEKGLSHPYVLEYQTDIQAFIFFGSSHSNDPEDSQWQILEAKWQGFMSHANPNKTLLYENQSAAGARTLSRDEALRQYSESGLAVWLAHQADIPAESGEPDRVEEIEHLKKSYTVPEIMTYYFGRQMHQWLTQDYRTNPDWQNYASGSLRLYGTLGCWGGEELTLDKALTWFCAQTGKEFEPRDKQTLYALSDPSQSAVSSASGQYRDTRLFQTIQNKWQHGQDVFTVYGSGHAIILEPALKKLVE